MPDTDTTVLPRRKRKTRVDKPRAGSKALAHIDARLAEALNERQVAISKVALLGYWEDRLTKVTQEIESLIGYQQRLSGNPMTAGTISVASTPGGVPFVVGGQIPAGVTSVPAKQPSPSGANMADEIGTEAGFS